MRPNHPHITALNTVLALAIILCGFRTPSLPVLIPQTGFVEGAFDEPIAVTSGRSIRMLTDTTSTLNNFVSTVTANAYTGLVGVYADGVFALPIVQQPAGQAGYVSSQQDTVTQFSLASRFNTVGLLAHNYLSGEQFFRLKPGQEIVLVYGDGSTERYSINGFEQFQALTPNSPYSSFVNIDAPSADTISSTDLFYNIYGGENSLVLQTCIKAFGDPSWGRLFITASRVG